MLETRVRSLSGEDSLEKEMAAPSSILAWEIPWTEEPAGYSLLLLLLRSRVSRVRLLATPWTAAYQAPPSMGISRQEYWSGVPLPSPRL